MPTKAATSKSAGSKAKSTTNKAPDTGLAVVKPGVVLHWPLDSGNPPLRARAGDVVPADDPLLNTLEISEEKRRELGLGENDQRHKVRPATEEEAAEGLTPVPWARAQGLYAALGYDATALRRATPAGGKPAARARPSTSTKVDVPEPDE